MNDAEIQLSIILAGVSVICVLLCLLVRKKRRIKIGTCECGHQNIFHRDGKGACLVAYGISEKFPKGSNCACDIFIEKPEPPEPPKDTAAKQLEKMVGL
jgi:hypothetical protein